MRTKEVFVLSVMYFQRVNSRTECSKNSAHRSSGGLYIGENPLIQRIDPLSDGLPTVKDGMRFNYLP